MLKRFIVAFAAFIALIVPGTLALALLGAPARPASLTEPPGCDRNLKAADASVAAIQERVRKLSRADAQRCPLTRQYFLEVVKARAVTALCKRGTERDRELVRLDADVEHINSNIAANCG